MKTKIAWGSVFIGGALLASFSAHSASWSDNSLGVRYGTHFSEAGIGRGITKTIYNFTHVNGDDYGVNFFTLDTLISDGKDPAVNSNDGAQEMYGFYQRTVPLSVFGLSSTPDDALSRVSALLRVDLGTKNTEFSSRPRKFRLGLNYAMPLEKGLWDMYVSAYKETNHNGIVGQDVSYDTTWSAGTVWSIPLGPGEIGGFACVIGPKGEDGFGNDTKTEVLVRVSYLFNIGATGLKAGVAYEHWRNMYGSDESIDHTGGSRGNTPLLITEYHF